MSRGTPDTACLLRFSLTGLSPSTAGFPKTVLLTFALLFGSPYPGVLAHRFGLFPVRSPLLRKSLLFSLPPGT